MKNKPYKLCAPCLFGLESVLSGELKRLGFEDISVTDGRVEFTADAEGIARANLNLRTAERVLIVLDSFRAVTFQQLIDGLGMTSRLPTDAHGVMHDDDGQDHAHSKNGGVIAVFQTGGHRQCGHGGRVTAGHSAVPREPFPVDGAVHRQIDKELQELRCGPGQQRVHQQVVAENIRKHRYTPIM